jgi:ubiquinone/menaquinone biosynthesis C-methylase UbiE
VRIADAGGFQRKVLDVGCGTGENAVFLAERGYDVLAIDYLESVVATARERSASSSGLPRLEFKQADAFHLDALGQIFDSVLDCATFHGFSDRERPAYARSLRQVTQPGSMLYVIGFSDQELRPGGPRRLSLREIRDTFAKDWTERSARIIDFECVNLFAPAAKAWSVAFERKSPRRFKIFPLFR